MKSKLILLLIVTFVISGCAAVAEKPKDIKDSQRPSLTYTPSVMHIGKKYPLTVGVLTLSDKRPTPFYQTDNFFAEDIVEATSNMLFAEIRGSGLFDRVVRIKVSSPEKLNSFELMHLAEEHNVDMILVGNITRFNLVRAKEGSQAVTTAKVGVEVKILAQLIFPDYDSIIIWGDEVGREEHTVAATGMVSPSELGVMATNAMVNVFDDIKNLIYRTGRKML